MSSPILEILEWGCENQWAKREGWLKIGHSKLGSADGVTNFKYVDGNRVVSLAAISADVLLIHARIRTLY